jgi:hypothetical protein
MSFPITCTACNKTFTISDEIFEKKVAGRVVTIKCKACGQGIRVDGTKRAPTTPPGSSVAPATASAAPVPAAVAAPVASAAPPSSDEPLWAVDYPDGQDREFTTAEVVAELERGAVEGNTLVWRDGMAEWLEVHQVPELARELSRIVAKKKAAAQAAAAAAQAAAAAAQAAAAKAAKPAPVHTPRAPMPTVTGLGGLPGAGGPKARAAQPSTPELTKPRATQPSTPELTKPRATQPSRPELLAKPRAAQPSAPFLPKAPGPAPLAPATAAPSPTPPFAAPSPTPPFAAPPPMPIPSAQMAAPPPAAPPPPLPQPAPPAPTPPLPASVANVVSRPAPVPAFPAASPPFAAPLPNRPAIVADHASVEWPEARSKKPLVVVIAVVLAIAIGGALLALSGKDPPPPPSTPISALPASPGTPATATATATAATSTTGQTSAAQQPGADTASGSDPVVTSSDTTPGAGFAEMFAAGARKAESKGATVAPTARFDAAATKAPLARAATEAQACKQSGGPAGKVTVVVTFAPDGKVASATITDAPFAGTAIGACISSAFKRAAIAPFSGLPGTVSKTFSIL